MDTYRSRHCALIGSDEENFPCWGAVRTVDVLQFEEGDFFVNTCEGHRLMLNNGPYIVEPPKTPR